MQSRLKTWETKSIMQARILFFKARNRVWCSKALHESKALLSSLKSWLYFFFFFHKILETFVCFVLSLGNYLGENILLGLRETHICMENTWVIKPPISVRSLFKQIKNNSKLLHFTQNLLRGSCTPPLCSFSRLPCQVHAVLRRGKITGSDGY